MKKKILVILTASVIVNAHADNSIAKKPATPKFNDILANNKTDLNIKVVNSLGAMQVSDSGKVAAKSLEQKREELTQDIQKEEQKIAQAVNEFKGKSVTLSASAREKEEKGLRSMENGYKSKLQESEYELKSAMQKTSEELSKEVKEAVDIIAQSENIDLVVDGMSGQVIYVSEKVDMTDKVVEAMNKNRTVKLAQAGKKDDLKTAQTKPVTGKATA